MEELMQTMDLRSVGFVTDMIVEENEIGLVYGSPGTGKTEALKHTVEKFRAGGDKVVLIEGYGRINVLKELCNALDLDQEKTNDMRFISIRDTLKRQNISIFIDEAENISYRGLEWIRRLWDFCKIPVLLVGTETLYKNMQGAQGQRRQLYRRVRAKWSMQGLNPDELKEVCKTYGYEKPKNIAKMCGNNFDKAVNVLSKMKRFAERGKMDINKIDVREVARFIILD